MITIQKNQSNNITFTLNEKTTLDPVFYVLALYSNQDHDTKTLLLGTDVSLNPIRWNEFVIVEDPTADPINGVITLDVGTYDYFVWQSSVESIDLDLADSIVESGLFNVNGIVVTPPTYDDTQDEYTYYK